MLIGANGVFGRLKTYFLNEIIKDILKLFVLNKKEYYVINHFVKKQLCP